MNERMSPRTQASFSHFTWRTDEDVIGAGRLYNEGRKLRGLEEGEGLDLHGTECRIIHQREQNGCGMNKLALVLDTITKAFYDV